MSLASIAIYVVTGTILFVLAILSVAIILYIIRTFWGPTANIGNMRNKVVLITGANSGIGKETALELAAHGARVLMACRTLSTAKIARDEIIKASGNVNVEIIPLDLGCQSSIRDCCAKILATESRLDVLVHNAACAHVFKKSISPDGLQLTMATNHFGPFLMTHLLIDLLKKSSPSRIVVVASKAYRVAHLDIKNLNPKNKLPAYLYALSKYANIVWTYELARRLRGTGVTANCLHPGSIDTGIWRNIPFPLNLPMKIFIAGFLKTSKQGAQTSIHLAAAPELENVSGKYFRDCKESDVIENAKNCETGRQLWEKCEKYVNLTQADPKI